MLFSGDSVAILREEMLRQQDLSHGLFVPQREENSLLFNLYKQEDIPRRYTEVTADLLGLEPPSASLHPRWSLIATGCNLLFSLHMTLDAKLKHYELVPVIFCV